MNLIISEKFYSIQGEGRNTGFPSIFIRLAGCNLLCKSDDWVCDSIEVWKKGNKTPFEKVLTEEEVKRLREGSHLILTGGEPLLHQTKLIEYLNWFDKNYHFIPFIEIETNGTIEPKLELDYYTRQYNCSPKLSSSGEEYERRKKDYILDWFNKSPKTYFKFVITSEQDVLELINEFGRIIDLNKVYLMPSGETQEKLNQTRAIVIEQCLKLGLKYTDRLHIIIWNKKTGV